MSLWILLVVVAQFLYAIVSLVDKYIVTSERALPKPLVYAFYVSILSAGSIFIYFFSWIPIPHDDISVPSFALLETPTLLVAALSLLAGYSFFYALVSLFSALRHADASDVVPVVGAVSALATFILSYIFLGANLGHMFFSGLLLLVCGTLLMSHFRFTWKTAFSSMHAGILFAIHYVAIKALFIETSFDNGFFWSRMAIVLVALSILLVPRYYEKITHQTKATGKRGGMLVVGNKIIAGLASILVLKAVELGDVSVVQALGGMQYVFLLLLGLVLGAKLDRECGEKCGERDWLKKSFATSIIVLGFFVLFL